MPGQVHVPEEGPSTSGYDHTNLLPEEELSSNGRSLRHEKYHNSLSRMSEAVEKSGINSNLINRAHKVPENLYCIKNGRLEKLITFVSALSLHFTIGRIDGGFLRPLYSETGNMVILDNRDGSLHQINNEQAAHLGINKPYIPK